MIDNIVIKTNDDQYIYEKSIIVNYKGQILKFPCDNLKIILMSILLEIDKNGHVDNF